MIGRFLTFVAALTAFALAAALILPAMTDWTAQRAALESRLGAAIGGPVALNGAVAVRLLPTPRLTAADVDLADEQRRLSIEGANVRAELDLWPLFAGRVVVNRIVLAEGAVRLDGDAPALRELADELAARLSAGQGTYRYLVAPAIFEWGTLQLTGLRVEAWSSGPDTPIRATLRAGQLFGDATLRPQADASWHVTARAVWGDDLLDARFTGLLTSFAPGAPLSGEVTVTSANLAALWGKESGPPLSIRGPWQATGNQWRTDSLSVTLGTARGTLDLRLDTHTDHFFDVALGTSLADLDALGVSIADLRHTLVATLMGGTSTNAPSWLNGRIRVDADGLLLGGRAIRDSSFDFLLTHGQIALTSADAQLPGGTHLMLTPRRDLARRLEIQSENLRALLDWADYDVTAIAGDRLQSFMLDAAIREGAGPQYIALDRLQIDGGTIEGTLEEGDDGRFEVTLAVAGLNLDAYAALGAHEGFVSRVAALSRLLIEDRLSALSVSGVNVVLGGAEVARGHVAVRHVAGSLLIDEARLAFANQGTLVLAGSWSPTDDISLRITGTRLAPSLFEGLPIRPRSLADLNATIGRTEAHTGLDVSLLSEGLRVTIEGAETDADGFDAHIVAVGEEPGALAAALGLEAFAATTLEQREHLTIDWTGPLSGGEVTAELALPGLALRANGAASSPLGSDITANLNVRVSAASARTVVQSLGGPELAPLDQMTLMGDGTLRIGDGNWRYTSAAIAAGDQTILLGVGAALDGTTPLTARVGLQKLTLAPPRQSDGSGDDPAASTPQLAWSTSVFDSGWLTSANAEVTLEIGELQVGDSVFSDARARMGISSGALTLSHATAHFGDGVVTGSGSVVIDGPALLVSADLAGEALPASWIAELGDLPALTGEVTLAAHLTSRGRSPFDLVAGLGGRIDVGWDGGGFETVAMMPFAEEVGTVRTRRALRDAANAAMVSGPTPIAQLDGSIAVSRGVIDFAGLDGVAVTGPFTLAGRLDLRSQIVDVEAQFQLSDKEAGPVSVLVAFRGAGGALSQSIDITQLQDAIGARLTDTPQGLLSEEDLPEDLQELLREYEDAFPADGAAAD